MAKSESCLVFREGEYRFGLSLSEVERIEKAVALEEITTGAEFVKGFFNYHGELLSVIDIRKIFQLPALENKLTDLLIIANTKKGACDLGRSSKIELCQHDIKNS